MFDLWSQAPGTLSALVMRQAAACPARPALIEMPNPRKPDQYRVTNCGDMHAEIIACAARMQSEGLVAGDHIAIWHALDRDFVVAILAAWHVGAVVVLPDPVNPEESLRAAMHQIPFRFVLAGPAIYWRQMLSLRRKNGRMVSLAGWMRQIRRGLLSTQPKNPPEKTAENPALPVPEAVAGAALMTLAVNVQGYVHGIQRSHAQILNTHASLTGLLDVRDNERCYVNMMLPLLSVLAEGGTALMPAPGATAQVHSLWPMLADHGATSLFVTAPVLEMLVADGRPEDHRLHQIDRIVSFGTPVFPDVQDRLCLMAPWCRIDHIYTSEAAGPIAATRFGTRSTEDHLATSVGRGILSGAPLAEYRVAILPDDFGIPLGGFSTAEFAAWTLPAGETGEIVVSCDYEMPSFWQGRGEFENAFMVDEQRWYRTGDAGFVDPQGRIWHQGRCQARIADKLGTVYPMAIEAAARAQMGPIRIACVDASDGPVLVIEQSNQLDHDVLYDVLSATGISRIVVIDKIPVDKSRGNRVDYRRLAMLLAARRDMTQPGAGDEPVRQAPPL